MSLHFKPSVSSDLLTAFEQEYEEALQEDPDALKLLAIQGRSMVLWDGVDPIAVTSGIAVARMQPIHNDLTDIAFWNDPAFNARVLYMYSTTVRKEWQGKGYGRLLCAYYAGFMRAQGFQHLIGHATSDSMRSIRKWQHADFFAEHKNWCGSERTAVFYDLAI